MSAEPHNKPADINDDCIRWIDLLDAFCYQCRGCAKQYSFGRLALYWIPDIFSADVALVTSDPNFGMCWMYHNKGNTASNEIVTHKIRATFWTLCLNISYMCGNTILRHLIVLIVARPMLTRKHNMDSQWSCYTNNVCKDGRHRMEVQWLDTMQPLFPRHCEDAHCFVMCESNENAK